MNIQPDNGDLRSVPRIVFGCMRLAMGRDMDAPSLANATTPYARARKAVETALSLGITKFDHADIYCRGESEAIFSRILRDLGIDRTTLTLQSKCGMVFSDESIQSLGIQYDLSHDHIVRAVENSLRRLETEYLDILLLHRPDILMEPAEIARAFDSLQAKGKVRRFGVSNCNSSQIELLRRYIRQPLTINQLELHLLNTSLIDAGLVSDTGQPTAATTFSGTLEYCRSHDIQLEAWSPLAGGKLGAEALQEGDERVDRTKRAVEDLAMKLGVESETIAIAWLVRHPARVQPVIGTLDPRRIRACVAGLNVALTREQWYRLYGASRGKPLH